MLPAPHPGDSIGPYRLGEPLGAGGAGAVFATDGASGEALAIKIVRGDGVPEMLSRARREMEALGRVAHPNVLPLCDFGHDDDQAWLVTPRIGGVTLRQMLADGPLLPETAALVIQQAAAGAGAIHDAGLVHRDLKPDNIMVTDDGRVVVIDLGLALAPDWTRHTVEGAIAGSLPYMAPEQIEGRATPASDVWALCVSLWELAAGRRPFGRDRAQEEVAAILGGVRAPFVEADRRVDPALAAIVEAGLTAAPERRPHDGGALAYALFRWLDGVLDTPTGDAIARIRADRAGWEAHAARRVVSAAARRAATLAAAGDPFAAMRSIDRGLAYAPDDPELSDALARVVPVHTPAPVAPRRPIGRWVIAAAVAVALIGGVAAFVRTRPVEDHRLAVSTGFRIDRTNPESVIAALIHAAATGEAELLPTLCLPDAGDRDVHELCATTAGTEHWPEFRAVFGTARILGSKRTGLTAHVGLRLGNGNQEEIELVLRDGAWYLGQF